MGHLSVIETKKLDLAIERLELVDKALIELAIKDPAGKYTAKELAEVTGIPYRSLLRLLEDEHWSLVFQVTEKPVVNKRSDQCRVTAYHLHRFALACELAEAKKKINELEKRGD